MTYRVVTSHLIGGTTWSYLPDEMPEYPVREEAMAAAHFAASGLLVALPFPAHLSVKDPPKAVTVTWEADGYPRGRRFEVVEDA